MAEATEENKPYRGRHINPVLHRPAGRQLTLPEYLAGLRAGDRTVLSRAITLVESTRPDHQALAQEILEQCRPAGATYRLGITGAPGVGKSTFIDRFGRLLLDQGRRPAILTVDPSSHISRGSILGDKTRMEHLARDERVYIRPSPAASTLGGVARKTRESILLCEAAGFDIIIVETVGVGQSETAVRWLVDFFLLLLQPGAGDELQGVKRGIVEMADLLAVNKADGKARAAAERTRRDYQQATHLLAPGSNGRRVPVVSCSALTGSGLEEIWQLMREFRTFTRENGHWERNRREQGLHWLHHSLNDELRQLFFDHPVVQQYLPEMERSVRDGALSPFRAAKTLIRLFIEAKA